MNNVRPFSMTQSTEVGNAKARIQGINLPLPLFTLLSTIAPIIGSLIAGFSNVNVLGMEDIMNNVRPFSMRDKIGYTLGDLGIKYK